MDIPKEISTAIGEGADNEYPIGYTTSRNALGNVGFRIGAIFGYNLAQKELEEKDKKIVILKQELADSYNAQKILIDVSANELALKEIEIERLKGLLKEQTFLIYPWPKQREEMWEEFKKENNI